ncbi:MAG: phosphoribosylaminoimidazolesuccinocarboxamide synthase [Deltaproteobacteria bacterium]|nr:phosphoribosylaminoimidazolesuccinocarboxamide synthase [Deltaproteobacteria bacterium]
MAEKGLRQTSMSTLKLMGRGKVRDIYEVSDCLLIVASDRISAFDVIMNEPIPGKGEILTTLSAFWFERMKDIVPNHLLSTDVDAYPAECRPYAEQLAGRSMLVRKAKPLPVECVVRGYLSGSGWKDYRNTGAVSGVRLPSGLAESSKLPEPVFTPSTKAEQGHHDLPITRAEVANLIGIDLTDRIIEASLLIYRRAQEIADRGGIIIADTKLEFGIASGKLILIDELLTPDSSRFWPKDTYEPGRAQNSFDKQFLRDYLESLDWNKEPPPPALPTEIIVKTKERYAEALERIIR